MRVLTCAATRRRLHAYHDEELTVSDQIAVGAHLEWCDHCAATFAELRVLRATIREATSRRLALSGEEQVSLGAAVVSRMKAERTVSFEAGVREMFADFHLVYAGLGAAAVALACFVIMLGMMRLARSERPDMFAGLINALASRRFDQTLLPEPVGHLSPGSNQNPLAVGEPMRLPRSLEDPFATMAGSEAAFTLSAVVTREGRVENPALVDLDASGGRSIGGGPGEQDEKLVQDLFGVVSRARFEPARVAGHPVAVNMVWLVTHTTVRAPNADINLPALPATVKRRQAHVAPLLYQPVLG